MSSHAETPIDLALARIAFRLVGYRDARQVTSKVFADPPLAALIGRRWSVICICWLGALPVLGLVWLGLWVVLHAAGIAGSAAATAGYLFVAGITLVGALDACWRALVAWPVSSRIRRRDITETALTPILRLAQFDDRRLLLQLLVGVGAALYGALFWR